MTADIPLERLSEFEWLIPAGEGMRAPALVLASEQLLKGMKKDTCLHQTRNMATLRGVVGRVVALSDAHQGYGFPIGGVAAFDSREGVISPGGVGYDINCGVRLLATDIKVEDYVAKSRDVLNEIGRSVPSGVGSGGRSLSAGEIREAMSLGSEWAVGRGMGDIEDILHTEEAGRMKEADPAAVSDRAVKRGMPQLGTLGSGNHFIEVQQVARIADAAVAAAFGLAADCVAVMIHCGSRGLGHQVAGDYIRVMEDKYGFAGLADRELINAPIASEMGRRYLQAMNCAVNFAFCNRQVITHYVRKAFRKHFSGASIGLVYDVCHNIAKMEDHVVEGEVRRLCVHRKGATRSFGPGRREVPEVFRGIGQPVLLPGSMGTASYVLVGTKRAEELTFGSAAHGAGRVESRTKARGGIRGDDIRRQLEARGIHVYAGSMKGLAEEAPRAYKDVDEVARVCHETGIGRIVARMTPLAVMKG